LAEVGAEFQRTIGLLSDNDTHAFRLRCLQILEMRQVESQWSVGRVRSGPGFLELSDESDVVRLCASMLRNRSVVLERFKDIEFSSRQSVLVIDDVCYRVQLLHRYVIEHERI